MGWDEHNRRRAAIKAVLGYAEQNPAAGLPYEALPAAHAVFRDRRDLVLALQHDWSQALWARIELLSLNTKSAPKDAADLARQAWAETAAKHPVLRRLLDEHRDDLGLAVTREDDLMVTAQLGLSCDEKVYRTPYVA
jgi:hypothetical protein